MSNDTDTHIGSTEKAGLKADSVQSVENKKFYETKEEKQQFIRDRFQLDANEILDADEKLKEAVIKLFLDNFEDLARDPWQYGETEVLEIKIEEGQRDEVGHRSKRAE